MIMSKVCEQCTLAMFPNNVYEHAYEIFINMFMNKVYGIMLQIYVTNFILQIIYVTNLEEALVKFMELL